MILKFGELDKGKSHPYDDSSFKILSHSGSAKK